MNDTFILLLLIEARKLGLVSETKYRELIESTMRDIQPLRWILAEEEKKRHESED